MTDNIEKLFFQNINGLVRIFNIKNINFKLIVTPINNSKHKITYHFIDNILTFPNNISDIIAKFKYILKNLNSISNENDLINFYLEIYENNNVKISSELNIYFNNLLNVNKKNISNKNQISDEGVNDLIDFYFNNNFDDDNLNDDDDNLNDDDDDNLNDDDDDNLNDDDDDDNLNDDDNDEDNFNNELLNL
jgi:hypothetical protein